MWKILPHGPLVQLAPRLWQATGELKNPPLPRAMTVWRMDDGGLLVHSVVNLDEAAMAALEALGTPRVMVVPNGFHRMDAAAWKARYPDLRVVCPAAVRAKVEEKVKVDGDDTDLPGVVTHTLPGCKEDEHAYELDSGDGKALLFCDALFNVDHRPGFGGFVLKLVGSTGFFGMTRVGRLALLKDAAPWKAWLAAQAERDDVTLVTVAHGNAVVGKAQVKEKLAAAAARL